MNGEQPEPRNDGGPNSAIIYMVSIYLLLIAFFVIMHTISKKEEVRTAAVVGSLQMTFERPDERMEDLPSTVGKPKLAGPNEVFRERVESLFGAFVETARFSQVSKGNVLRVTMPVEALFYAGSATLRADRLALVREIADMIANPRPYRQNMIAVGFEMGPARDAREDAAPGRRLEIRRAGVLARDLVRHEVAPDLVTVGLLDGQTDTLRITFTSRSTADSTDGEDDDDRAA